MPAQGYTLRMYITCGDPMVRTQIYLTESEQERLQKLSRQTGRSQSELIREAIDGFLDKTEPIDALEILSRTAGMWSGRTDLPDFAELRAEGDRRVTDLAE
jgi:predicted DNA-binding protein